MNKNNLRQHLRDVRRQHVQALPASIRPLLFKQPPASLSNIAPQEGVVGLYHAGPFEAPAAAYARHFFEGGATVALPRFSSRDAAMEFAAFADPFDDESLVDGPFGIPQPDENAESVVPDVLFVPLVGFTAQGDRLGQGGGHYDRWLAEHPNTVAIGLAWDCQLVEDLPSEPHDVPLSAVVTPTRTYGPFA